MPVHIGTFGPIRKWLEVHPCLHVVFIQVGPAW
jgi:hypothetical protein